MLLAVDGVKFLLGWGLGLGAGCSLQSKVPFGLGAGAGGWGWVLLGWTGLVLLCTAQNPARLVYGSAALVASLRGQHCHFATLPIISNIQLILWWTG